MASFTPFLFAALLFILFKFSYYYLGLSVLCHPICAGIVFWLFTGDFNFIFVALFFELLWLDLFYVGTFVPPDALFAYLLCAPLLLVLGIIDAPGACIPILFCLPFAYLGSKCEMRLRFMQGGNYEKLNQAVDTGSDIVLVASRIMKKTFLQFILLGLATYLLSATIIFLTFTIWLMKFGNIYRVEWVNWSFLLCLAALGALLALRIPVARVCFGACVIVVGCIYLF